MYRKTVVLSIIVVAALALTACGEQVQELEQVNIAVLMGELVWEVLFQDIATMALEEYNARGIGVPVEYTHFDTASPDDVPGWFSPDIEAEAVRQATEDPEVVFIFGGISDEMTRGGLPVANESGIAYVALGSVWAGFTQPGYAPGEPGIFYPTGERNFFRGASRDDQTAALMIDFLQEEIGDIERAYITYWPINYGAAGQVQLAAMDADIEVVGFEEMMQEVELETSITEETMAMAQRIVDAEPDIFIIMGAERNLLYAVRSLDPDLSVIGSVLAILSYYDPPEDHDHAELEGIYQQDPYPHPDLYGAEESAAFLSNYEARVGEPAPAPFEGQIARVYDEFRFALMAIENAEEITRAGVLESMYALEYEGVTGDWHYTPEGDMSFAASAFSQIQDGEWVTLDFIIEETE